MTLAAQANGKGTIALKGDVAAELRFVVEGPGGVLATINGHFDGDRVIDWDGSSSPSDTLSFKMISNVAFTEGAAVWMNITINSVE